MKNVQYYMMVYNRSKEGERNMNILFFQWFAFMQKGIENALKKMNVSYDVFYYDMKDWDNDDELAPSALHEFYQKIKKVPFWMQWNL